jgi:hypothetical protein
MSSIEIPLSYFSLDDDGGDHSQMRRYFIDLFKKHLPDVEPSPCEDNVDAMVTLFIQTEVAAHKAGRPDPFPWFSAACAFALDQDIEAMMRAETGEEPTVN